MIEGATRWNITKGLIIGMEEIQEIFSSVFSSSGGSESRKDLFHRSETAIVY